MTLIEEYVNIKKEKILTMIDDLIKIESIKQNNINEIPFNSFDATHNEVISNDYKLLEIYCPNAKSYMIEETNKRTINTNNMEDKYVCINLIKKNKELEKIVSELQKKTDTLNKEYIKQKTHIDSYQFKQEIIRLKEIKRKYELLNFNT